jgi:phosphatidate cytidylyltransferase
MGYLIGVRRIEENNAGQDLLMMLFVIIWANDIFAYVIGKTLGRHPLAPVISPRKTVEGAVAGFLFGIPAAWLYQRFFLPWMGDFHAVLLGMLIGLAGQAGDLCESLVKRAANVKDSGAILPGHGGMLDRLDSLLFGAPAMYYYFYLVLQK